MRNIFYQKGFVLSFHLGGSIQKVCLLRRGGEGIPEKRTKMIRGRGVLACVYVRFFKKMFRFSKWSFIVTLQFFLLIIMAVWNIKQIIMKDYNIQSCQWMACDRFRQPFLLCTFHSFLCTVHYFAHFQRKWLLIH